MRRRTMILLALLILIPLSLLPILPDPFHREGNVSLWVWIYRELYELIYGEVGAYGRGCGEKCLYTIPSYHVGLLRASP